MIYCFLELPRQSVNVIETEGYEPGLSLAFAIAALFGKRIEEIFLHKPNSKKN